MQRAWLQVWLPGAASLRLTGLVWPGSRGLPATPWGAAPERRQLLAGKAAGWGCTSSGPSPSPIYTWRAALQAVKLDVDNSPVEMAFMDAVQQDSELRSLIGELMFEMHYTHRWVPQHGRPASHLPTHTQNSIAASRPPAAAALTLVAAPVSPQPPPPAGTCLGLGTAGAAPHTMMCWSCSGRCARRGCACTTGHDGKRAPRACRLASCKKLAVCKTRELRPALAVCSAAAERQGAST